jgi:hypothetical protein
MASATAQFTATNAAQKAISGDPNSPSSVLVKNSGAVNVFWGYTSAVTTTTGFLLEAGRADTVPLDPGEDLYVITAASSSQLYLARSRALTRIG